MRLPVWLLSLIVMGSLTSLFAGEFPPVDQLPVREELPDPLVMFDGTPVKTPEEWFLKRRPELKALFEHYVYGRPPAAPAKVEATIVRVDSKLFDGKATLTEIRLKVGPDKAPEINLLLILPNTKTPVPVFAGLNFCGNHAVLPDPEIGIPKTWIYPSCKGVVDNHATEAGRGSQVDVWAADLLVSRGYGLATFYDGDIDPDQHDFTDGIHPHFLKPGQTKLEPHEWGTIAAWAWGLRRVVDYLVTRPEIDVHRICAIGHSRLGKTALLAGALDDRFAVVVPHQSGTGGTALSRGNDQETVERINRVFPHWFNDNFPQFDKNENRLPVDQHLLMCMIAPRALLDTEGDQDKWANYDNSLKAIQAADKVYKFLGKAGIKGEALHRDETPFTLENTGDLCQYRRDEKHQLDRAYWKIILDFADLQWQRRK